MIYNINVTANNRPLPSRFILVALGLSDWSPSESEYIAVHPEVQKDMKQISEALDRVGAGASTVSATEKMAASILDFAQKRHGDGFISREHLDDLSQRWIAARKNCSSPISRAEAMDLVKHVAARVTELYPSLADEIRTMQASSRQL